MTATIGTVTTCRHHRQGDKSILEEWQALACARLGLPFWHGWTSSWLRDRGYIREDLRGLTKRGAELLAAVASWVDPQTDDPSVAPGAWDSREDARARNFVDDGRATCVVRPYVAADLSEVISANSGPMLITVMPGDPPAILPEYHLDTPRLEWSPVAAAELDDDIFMGRASEGFRLNGSEVNLKTQSIDRPLVMAAMLVGSEKASS